MIRRLGCTEGQAYTMVIGLVIAVLLAVTGMPSVLRDRPSLAGTTGTPASRDVGGTTSVPVTSPGTPSLFGIAQPLRAVAPPSAGLTGGSGASPPPAINSAGTAPGTITTFARVDHPGPPGGLAVGRDETIYVTTDNGTARGDPGASHVFSFDSRGTQIADRTIVGQPSGHVGGLTGAAVDPVTGHVAVLDPGGARILAVDMTSGAQRVLAQIPDLPPCLVFLAARPCQPGVEDRTPFPLAAAYDRQGNLFVTDPTEDTIWRLRPGERAPEVWYQSTDFTTGDGPYGLALVRGGVEFTVGTSVETSALTAGGLYRVAVNADGTAGARTLVARFLRDDKPGPLAVGSSGTAYVVLRQSGAIVFITPGGLESGRISSPGTGPIPLDTPSALALLSGRLLVANHGAGDDPTVWAVLAVSVNDGPVR